LSYSTETSRRRHTATPSLVDLIDLHDKIANSVAFPDP